MPALLVRQLVGEFHVRFKSVMRQVNWHANIVGDVAQYNTIQEFQMKKVRCLGVLFLVIALAVFLIGCRNPGDDDEYYGGGFGGGGNSSREVQNMPGFPGGPGGNGVGGAGGSGEAGVATIQAQISFLLDVHNDSENLAYNDFTVRANLTNETLTTQQDLNFQRNITVRILPPVGQTAPRIITGDDSGESLFRIRGGTTLVLYNMIVQERGNHNRGNQLIAVDRNANLEMNGHSEITGGRSRAVVVNPDSSLIMRDWARIHGNSHTGAGGAVQLSGADAALRMYGRASIDDNHAASGGGVQAHNGARVVMRGYSAIHNNEAVNDGGGVTLTAANNSRLYMYENASIHNNDANNGGGVHMISSDHSGHYLIMRGNNISIHSNTAGNRGGGVFLHGVQAHRVFIYNGTIYGGSGTNPNTASTNDALHGPDTAVLWGDSHNNIPWLGTNGTNDTISVEYGYLL